MLSIKGRLLMVASDFVAISLASVFLLWSKFVGGQLTSTEKSWKKLYPTSQEGPSFLFALEDFTAALALVYVFWLVLFVFYGLYRSQRYLSRLDEGIAVFKVTALGILLAFVATFDLDNLFSLTRALILTYWLVLFALTAGGRVALRSIQVWLLTRGMGLRNTVIVGSDARGVRLLRNLQSSPGQGYRIVGFVRARHETQKEEIESVPVLGDIKQLGQIVAAGNIESVLIALQSNSHEEILEIVHTAGQTVSFGITPDLYDIVTGHVRTDQIHGAPLMELKPELMPPWEQTVKRLFDVGVALVLLVSLAPIWLLTALLIKLESRGPVLFRQERVGQHGKIFTIYKFRSMVVNAEAQTGPVWVKGRDPRVTRMGRLLRTLHLDEIPQCLNFLRGDMSLVGPRPERPFFVDQFTQEIPLYGRRFNVKPGLMGWAQAKHEFDMDSKDMVGIAQERLEYDLYYIENMSLKLDLKIVLQTLWFVLAGKSTR
jgi:exopolysaccharide biosynthesis polyprenyl glycosylphosphotransferase